MLEQMFLQVVRLSAAGSLVILGVLLVRLLLKKAPAIYRYALWALVLLRLLCPYSFPVPWGVVPSTGLSTGGVGQVPAQATEQADVGVESEADSLDWAFEESISEEMAGPAPFSLRQAGALAWAAGAVLLFGVSLFRYGRLRWRLRTSVPLGEGVYLADGIGTPFVLGWLRPQVYLPSSLADTEWALVTSHERQHIRRGDIWWRLLAFVALCLHWFNPLVWLAFWLSGRDMEMSCDEAVMRRQAGDVRQAYAASLLNLTVGRPVARANPLAFGEGDTGVRIRNILRYKKPALWLSLLAILVLVAAAFLLLPTMAEKNTRLMGNGYTVAEVIYQTTDRNYPLWEVSADLSLYQRTDMTEEWVELGDLSPCNLTVEELESWAREEAAWQQKYTGGAITDAYDLTVTNAYFTVVFQTEKGETYLAQVNAEGGDGLALAYLVRLQSDFSQSRFYVNFFNRSLEGQLGIPVESFSSFQSDDIPGYRIVGFYIADSETGTINTLDRSNCGMGFAVFEMDEGYRLLSYQAYPASSFDKNGVLFCPDAAVAGGAGTGTDANTYDVILSKSSIPLWVERVVSRDGETVGGYEEEITGPAMVLFRWADMAEGNVVRQVIFDETGAIQNEENLPGFTQGDLLQEANDLSFTARYFRADLQEGVHYAALPALNGETLALSSVRHVPLMQLESPEAVTQFVSDYQETYRFDQTYDGDPALAEAASEYDEDFFSQKALFVLQTQEQGGDQFPRVKEVQVKEGTLQVLLKEAADEDEEANWFIFLELPRTAVEECTGFDAWYALQ